MSNYTKAPWTICEHSWSDTTVYDKDEKKIICRFSIYDEATEETQQELENIQSANAALIAAAPDLLEALQVAIKYVPAKHHGQGESYDNEDHKKIQAAINKATSK